jgi:hypothetical protein
MKDFNTLAALSMAAALRQGDRREALASALDITNDLDVVNSGIEPGKKYNDTELADLIESHMRQIEKGNANMNWALYIPTVVGAVAAWVEDIATGESDGKADSQPFEQSPREDSSGS